MAHIIFFFVIQKMEESFFNMHTFFLPVYNSSISKDIIKRRDDREKIDRKRERELDFFTGFLFLGLQ